MININLFCRLINRSVDYCTVTNLDDFAFFIADVFTDTGTYHYRTDECGDTSDCMDACGTCESMNLRFASQPFGFHVQPASIGYTIKERIYIFVTEVRAEGLEESFMRLWNPGSRKK